MPAGSVNVYTCQKCKGFTVTVDLVEGVTPFMIRCRAKQFMGGICDGMAESGFYRQPAPAAPAWEWYRPDAEEIERLDLGTREHVKQGGLLLRARAAS